jgi:hypothetical protein
VVGQQLAGADRVRQDQVLLQLRELLLRDVALGQDAEAGVDAVGRIALGDDGLDGGGRGLDRGVGFRARATGCRRLARRRANRTA